MYKWFIVLAFFWACSAMAAPVDINSASVKEIVASLKGIGQKKAEEIVDYRKKNGPFTSVDELLQVKGIGEKTLQKIRGDILLSSDGKPPKAKTDKSSKEKDNKSKDKKESDKKGSNSKDKKKEDDKKSGKQEKSKD